MVWRERGKAAVGGRDGWRETADRGIEDSLRGEPDPPRRVAFQVAEPVTFPGLEAAATPPHALIYAATTNGKFPHGTDAGRHTKL